MQGNVEFCQNHGKSPQGRKYLSGTLFQGFIWKILGRRILGVWVPLMSGVFEGENAAIIQRDFGGFPCRALVEPVWVRL